MRIVSYITFLGLAAGAYGQVVLNPTTTPAAATVGSTVTLQGTGYPAGTIANTSVAVTITPPPGNGAPVTTQSLTVLSVGASRLISFTIPSGLVVNSPILCSVSVAGSTAANVAYTTTTPSSITINPPATLSNISPGAGTRGTAVSVLIAGKYTTFQKSSTITVGAPGGITVSNITALSTQQLQATFTIDPAATPGTRDITVKSGTETATITGGFLVSAATGLSFSAITPNAGQQGQTLDVSVTGVNTHFNSTTFANFGDGIHVNTVTVNSLTAATMNISVDPLTYLGYRMVTLVTGGEFAASGTQGFQVTTGPASLLSVNPSTAAQSTSLHVTITGSNTHFLQNATTVSVGTGINVGNVKVNSPTSIDADIAVGAGAALGAHPVTVTTGGEVETLSNAFTVLTNGAPFLSTVTPASAIQGANHVLVNIAGVNTNFQQASIGAAFGSNITVNAITVNSTTSVTADISVDFLANVGSRPATLSSGATNFPFTFTVTASPAQITSVVPNTGPQGGSPSITLTGVNTHWVQGTTTASITGGSPATALTINRITVNSATSAVLDITIPSNAGVGSYTLTMTTGGEVAASAYSVFAATPTLTVSPSNGQIGTSVFVNFTGQFTHFVQGTTTLNISGQGVTFSNFNVLTPASATAKLIIDPAASLGGRTLTITTGTESVTTGFGATSTPAVLTSINPFHAPTSTTLNVTVTGQFTHFVQGTTTIGFGPDVTVNTVTVASPTQVTANITIAATAAYGWRNCFVNTGTEQLQIGFLIDSPTLATPAVTSVNPSTGFQGQTIIGVTISGQNTHWQQGVTQLILGAGVTVNNLIVNNNTSLTADIAISSTAPIGGNSVIAITGTGAGAEVASGTGFSVQKGAYQILSVTPNLVTQNQTVNVTIVGQATHWLQGGTTADFGAGINVDSLTIQDQTDATAQITILSGATVGFHSVTLNTGGEAASINQGLDVEQGTPTLLSSTPNSGVQGQTENIQVLGRFTHWQQGVTQASYGTGVIVNSITVQDSITAILNITVDPLAFISIPPCQSLMLTTGTEQVTLAGQFCIGAGPAQITNVQPVSSMQGSTITVHVTGANTHFTAGVTTANFGGGINVSAVHVNSATSADVDLAVTVNAGTGLRTVTLSTLGESASMANAFTVSPGVPTLNGVAPVSEEQGTTSNVHIIGQFTHWVQGTTTATFGQGITLNTLTIDDSQDADANITIDPLAYVGGRKVTFTTNAEIVSGNLFSVSAGPAIISSTSPSTGNQGQEKIITITGQGTHWAQGLSQFYMQGVGLDVTVNAFIVNSATNATADITISPTATLGARSIYISTAGEVLTDAGSFVVTGGVPSITYLSPGSGPQGATNLNVAINGVLTQWTAATTQAPNFGPGITVANYTVNSFTSITAVINIDPAATLGYNTVTVQTGAQTLSASFLIANPVPPSPYISYFNPSVGLPGKTFNTTFTGKYTNWDLTTQVTFGAGIHVNTFQVTSPTSALANITIDPAATEGVRTVTLTTGAETDSAFFNVVIATPYISIVDPGSAVQGEPGKNINVIGQYTTWDNTTIFNFGAGITINSVTVLGPTIAQVNIAVAQLAALGSRSVTATTGAEIDSGAGFSVTPSLAIISSVTPNTDLQNGTPTVTVVGQFTHWAQGSTSFSFSAGGISVTNTVVSDATHASITLAIAPLAVVGAYNLTATTGGEVATLKNAFIVQPGTPIILSSAPPTILQQNTLNLTVLGQFTAWSQATTTVSFGSNSGIIVGATTVTDPGGITASISAAATTPVGYRTLYVTTGSQVLTLPNAILVTNGPAAVTQLTPNNGNQGQASLAVAVVGTNTNFSNGVTTANFGQGVTVNSVTVTDATHAAANVSIAATAVPGLNTLTMTTMGEVAVGNSIFLINAATPVLLSVNPSSGAQGDPADVINVVGAFTHFQNGKTTANFGTGVSGSVSVADATHASVTIAISPTTAIGSRDVTLTTDLGGGNQEIETKLGAFSVHAGPALISAATPTSPTSVHQGDTSDLIAITGSATHFDGTSTVTFCTGVTATGLIGNSATSISVPASVAVSTPVGPCGVTVTTGGEVATGNNLFNILAGIPAITQLSVTSAHQGDSGLSTTVTSAFTHFVNGTTTANLGPGITINGVTVGSPTSATVTFSVGAGATLGARDVTLTTNSEVVVLTSGFTVLAPAAGTVSGHITNPDSSVAANIPVVLTPTSGSVQNTTTDGTGFYIFSNLANGTFTVLATNATLGYSGSGIGQITAPGQIAVLDIHMSICAPPPSGIIHWWPGEGNAGDVVGTSVGTLSGGAAFAPGKVGRGFSFNGAGLVSIPHNNDMNLTSLTMEGWVQMNSLPPAGGGSWFLVASKGISSTAENYGLYITQNLELVFEYWNGTTFPHIFSPMNVITVGSLHHVGVTADGTTVSFYVDGQPVGQVAQPSALLPNSNPFQIGSAEPSWGNRFNGVIDEWSLYNRPLSLAEIQAVYGAGSNGKCNLCIAPPSGLVSWWTGDSDATDIIGGNSGVAHGTVVYNQAHAVGGGGFQFNGSSYIQVADSPALEPTHVSVAAWVQAASPPGSARYILDKGVNSNAQYALYTGGGGLNFYIGVGGGSVVLSPSAPSTLWNGAFHHVVGTFDGTTVRLFVDGAQIGNGSAASGISYAGSDPSLYIGTYGGNASAFTWPGAIDEVQVFNRALTATEILAIYNASGAGECRPGAGSCLAPPSGATAWWSEDGNTSDLLGANNPAGANNITFVPGKIGLGAQFGSGSYIDIPPSPSLNNQQFTWSAWARPDGPGPNNDQYGNELFGRENDLQNGYKILWRPSDNRFILLYDNSVAFASTHAFLPGQFYLVNASYDGATYKLYVNGALEGSAAIAETLAFNSQPWNIGSTSLLARNVGFPRTWNGVIDEVQVFSRALSLAEIQSIYAAGQAGECKPAIAPFIKPVAYSMPNGVTGANSIHYWDDTYNGSGSNTTDGAALSGGLGQLTDGFVGGRPYTYDFGRGQGYEYVGWFATQPTILFDFGSSQNFHTVNIHSDSADSGGVVLWTSVTVDFSNDGVNFSGAVTYNTSAAQQNTPVAQFIYVPAVGAGRYVRLQFTHPTWLFLSEVQFQ